MKYWGLLLAGIMAVTGAHAADAIDLLSVEKDTTETVLTSLAQIEDLAKSTQKQFWQLVPPTTDDPLYIHPDNVVRAVGWKSKGWPKSFLKQMVAEMRIVGSSRSMYPFYKLTVVETRDGELVYYNSYEQEVWRTPAPLGYNEYLFAFQSWNVDSAKDLSAQQKTFGRSSNVGLEVLLLPEVFMASYEEDVTLEAESMVLAAPEIVEMPLPAVVASIETLENGTVLVHLEDPSDSDGRSAEYAVPSMMMAMAGESVPPMLDQNPLDGLSDVWVREMAGGVIDPLDSDLDGDGMSFQAEHDLGLNPNVANPDFFKIIWSDIFNPLRLALELNDVQGVDYELDESYNLVAGNWLYIPLVLNGNTNPGPYLILIPDSAPETFWRIRSVGFQNSGDDLLNDFEEYLLGISINLAESDGDGLSDVYEFINNLDPASATGGDGALGDVDNDGFSNLEEQLKGTGPQLPDSIGNTGTVATIRYYYDEDDRLTDFYSGAEVAQRTVLTVSHNISEEVSAK